MTDFRAACLGQTSGGADYNWNWGIFFQPAPDGTGAYWWWLVTGLGWTLATALSAWVIALTLGSIVGTLRTTPNRWVVRARQRLRRDLPQHPAAGADVPVVLRAAGGAARALGDVDEADAPAVGLVRPGAACLGFYTSARVAEQVRAGIQSLPRGQHMAGTALGHTLAQTYRYILLPQAFRIILPPLTSEFMNIMKNSSVALTIGLVELTARARAIQEFSFQVFEAFTAATVIYVAGHPDRRVRHAVGSSGKCRSRG